LREHFNQRLEMHAWDWATGWAALEALGQETRRRGEYTRADTDRAAALVESLARYAREGAETVMDLLEGRPRSLRPVLVHWLEPVLVDLAGAMRLEAAAALLVERLHREDIVVPDACVTALIRIGGDAVVEAVAGAWPEASSDFCFSATDVLEHVHTDLSARTCRELLAAEEDLDVQLSLGHAILGHFCEEDIEPVRALVEGPFEDLDPEQRDLRYRLVAACTVMGASFPEYEAWYDEACRDRWGWEDYEPLRLSEEYDRDQTFSGGEEEEEEKENAWQEPLDDSLDDTLWEDPSPSSPIIGGQRIGRNDPCPCGSGKKYKQCCLKKQEKDWLSE
jgi:hypothetical protein